MSRPHATLVSLRLPLPPSVNQAFASRRNSHLTMKTAAYKFWQQQVREVYGDGGGLPTLGGVPYGLWIDLSPRVRGDIDNRVKLVSDIIKRPDANARHGLGVVVDDKEMWALHVALLAGMPRDACGVTVVCMKDWPAYVTGRM